MHVSINLSAAINVADEILKGDTMRIKISTETAEQLQAAFDEAHPGRYCRYTSGIEEAYSLAREGERQLESWGLPKSARKGLRIAFRGASSPYSSAKGLTPVTEMTLERGSTDWYLTSVAKAYVYPKKAQRFDLEAPEAMRQDIIQRTVGHIGIRKEAA